MATISNMKTPKQLAEEVDGLDIWQIYRWINAGKLTIIRPFGSAILIPGFECSRIRDAYTTLIPATNDEPLLKNNQHE